MKKAIPVFGCVLFFFVVLLPFGVILFDCFGYTFKLANYFVFAIITALLAVGTVILSGIMKKPLENKAVEVLFALITPFSLINTVFYLFECSTVSIVVSMFACVCCCVYLAIRYGKPLALKITALVLSALMILPIGFFGFLALIFGDFGQITVVQSVESPTGAYYAEVVDSDQGALGGDTYVTVYANKSIDLLIFKISKEPQRVYYGDWGEFMNMEIYWKDDHCLVINSVEYTIQ